MTWPCRLFRSREAVVAEFGFVPVGAMWPNERLLDGTWEDELAPNYRRDWLGKRPPLLVETPGGAFCVDSRAYNAERGHHGDGWTVTGEAPNLSVSPSINQVGRYHDYLQNGVITDDCEGHTFPDARGFP